VRPQQGILPNYYQFVQPQVRLNEELQQQQNQLERQSQRLMRLATQMEGGAGLEGRRRIAPTGTQSRFMNFGHWYPQLRGGAGPLRR
jgi:hypothetical protein